MPKVALVYVFLLYKVTEQSPKNGLCVLYLREGFIYKINKSKTTLVLVVIRI